MPDDATTGWSTAQRRLHWLIAAAVLLAAPVALAMVALPLRQLLLKFALYQLHKTLGITAWLLVLAQLALHARRGRPAWSETLSAAQRRAARLGHVMLFALLLVVPPLGYLTAASAPARIPTLFLGVIRVPHIISPDAAWFAVLRPLHLVAACLLLALAAGHAAMALHHHVRGADTLRRMWRAG